MNVANKTSSTTKMVEVDVANIVFDLGLLLLSRDDARPSSLAMTLVLTMM